MISAAMPVMSSDSPYIIPAARPALSNLIAAMERLSWRQRNEIACLGRRAKAAKVPRIRRLTREVTAEARRLAREGL